MYTGSHQSCNWVCQLINIQKWVDQCMVTLQNYTLACTLINLQGHIEMFPFRFQGWGFDIGLENGQISFWRVVFLGRFRKCELRIVLINSCNFAKCISSSVSFVTWNKSFYCNFYETIIKKSNYREPQTLQNHRERMSKILTFKLEIDFAVLKWN